MTPEAKVKGRIHALLAANHAYAVNYIGGMHATNGTPDILACQYGRFIGIEAKAGKGKLTPLQYRALGLIDAAHGLALVINETNLGVLKEALDGIHNARSNYQLFEPKSHTPDDAGATPATAAGAAQTAVHQPTKRRYAHTGN